MGDERLLNWYADQLALNHRRHDIPRALPEVRLAEGTRGVPEGPGVEDLRESAIERYLVQCGPAEAAGVAQAVVSLP